MDRRSLLTSAVAMAALPQVSLAQSGPNDPIMNGRLARRPTVSPWPNEWFEPQERVRGSGTAALRPVAPLRLDPIAAEAAWRFANERQSDGLIVVRDGRTIFARFVDGFDAAAPRNSYHLHWLPLVLAIGAAIDRGLIRSVDDPVGRYVTEWRGDARGDISLRNLLNQAAGLTYYMDSSKPQDPATHIFFGGQRQAAVLAWTRAQAPGLAFEYNYIVPELLGLVLQRATGERYATFLSRAIWRPAGLPDSWVWVDRPGGAAYHNAALFAPPAVWVKLGALLAGQGMIDGRRIVSEGWIEEMRKPSVANPNFGFIWLGTPHNPVRKFSEKIPYSVLAAEPFAVEDLMIGDGYIHRIYASAAHRSAVIIIGTNGKLGAERRSRWDDAVVPNLIFRGLRA